MSEAQRNQPRQLHDGGRLLARERPLVGRVGEHAHPRDVASRVVIHRGAGAEQPLNLRHVGRSEPHGDPLGLGRVLRVFQLQAAQPPLGRRVQVHRAVHRHLAAVRRVHAHLVRAAAPQIRHVPCRHRDERPDTGAEHVLPEHGVRVQPELRPSKQAEAQVEHFQRQAVAGGLVILPDEPPPLQNGQQSVHRGRRLPHRPGQVADTETALGSGQRLAQVERLLERRPDVFARLGHAYSTMRNAIPSTITRRTRLRLDAVGAIGCSSGRRTRRRRRGSARWWPPGSSSSSSPGRCRSPRARGLSLRAPAP